eukprot:gene12639-16947_t
MAHQTPKEGSSCLSCWDDIESSNYVEYKETECAEWSPSGFCINCVNHLISAQWDIYKNSLAKTTCKAEQRRLLEKGPPINLSDATALPSPNSPNGEIFMLWFMNDNLEHSPKLEGSLVDEEREAFWQEQKQFYISDEVEDDSAKVEG